MSSRRGRLFDTGAAAQHDEIGKRHLRTAALARIELRLNALKHAQHLGQLRRVVDRPALLRHQPDPGSIGPAALVSSTECGCRCPCSGHQLRHCETRRENARLQHRDVAFVNQGVVNGGHWVLPQLRLGRHHGAQTAHVRAHVAMGQLVPGTRERICELIGVLEEPPRNDLVGRVRTNCHVGGGHHGRVRPRGVVRVGHRARGRAILGSPLVSACGAGGQLPLIAEQDLKVRVVPGDRCAGPRTLDAARNGVDTAAGAHGVVPAEALKVHGRALGCRTHILARVSGAVGLAKGVPTGHQRHGLLVMHCHTAEGLSDVHG